MSYTNISAAFATRLNGLSSSYSIGFENQSFDPPANEAYLVESLNPTVVAALGLKNSGTDALEGFYQVLCYAPAGSTKGAAFAAADAVEGQFARGLRLTQNGVTASVLRSERSPGFVSGDRFVVPVTIYYRALV